MAPIADTLGRPLQDLRISVTDRCNMRCGYCMPREVFGAGHRFIEPPELLSFQEIARLVGIAAQLGVRKVRLTGGEPLLRRHLERLVEMLAGTEGIEEVALTTNGLLLAGRARALADAGLTRATVSLDALEQQLFERMSDTRRPVSLVLAGIEAAQQAGLVPVKVNMVVIRGRNDSHVLEMAEHFRGRPQTLRFIEYMDVGESNGWRRADVVPAAEILEQIGARWPLRALAPTTPGEVASRYRYVDGAGEIGFISSVSKPFCGTCNRARLSAEGRLYTCLFARSGHDLRALLRAGAADGEIAQSLAAVWGARADRYSELRSLRADPTAGEPRLRGGARVVRGARRADGRVEMSYIGG